MVTLLLFIPAAALFMAINVILGCYVAILLGYGPPNWQTALNQVVRITTFQNCLNAGRDWLGEKAPWADQFLDRLRVPKPIVIVDTTPEEENIDAESCDEITSGSDEEPIDVSSVSSSEELIPSSAIIEQVPPNTDEVEGTKTSDPSESSEQHV